MKKIGFYSVVCLLLVGCGGGGSTAGVQTGTNITNNNTTGDNVKTSIPFNAPILSESAKNNYLLAINTARSESHDCGKIDTKGEGIKDSSGNYIYDGTNIKQAVDPLVWNNKLYTSAAEHSQDLAAWNHNITTEAEAIKRFKHEGSGLGTDWTSVKHDLKRGSTVPERINNSGYLWFNIGENITAGTNTDTAASAVQSWLKSPPHCVNLMNAEYTEVGMAEAIDGDSFYTHYWTQNFGKPR